MGDSKRRQRNDLSYGTPCGAVARSVDKGVTEFMFQYDQFLDLQIESSDQMHWRSSIFLFFNRIIEILKMTGTGFSVPEEPEWRRAQLWADAYFALFLAIDRGWKVIERHKEINQTSPAKLLSAIVCGHASHWYSKSGHLDYRASCKSMAEDLRLAKKLFHGPANRQQRTIEQAVNLIDKRVTKGYFEPDFFLIHALCLKSLDQAQAQDKRIKDALETYDRAIDRVVAEELRLVRQGKGYGFIEGQQVEATDKAGVWRKVV